MVGLSTRVKEAYIRGVHGDYMEIPSEMYYSEFLKSRDREPLERFMVDLVEGLEKRGMKPTILAVGSSLHSKVHHDYRDIDLRVYHEEAMRKEDLVSEIKKVLVPKYSYKYGKGGAYVTETIMVPLESRVVVDILFGEDENVSSAEDIIRFERKINRRQFSILYGEKYF